MLGPELRFEDRDYVIFENRKLLYFAGIDYHRLSNHPKIIDTVIESSKEYGLNPTGSRTTTGNHFLYKELEKKIAGFFKTESSVVFSSGYLANIILLQALAEKFDVFFSDEVSHSSLCDAAGLFGKKIVTFKHLDSQDLKNKLVENISKKFRPLILTDGVFSARGEMPPLEEYVGIIGEYDGKILVDDAHAMAVAGPTGKGSWEYKGIDRKFIYQTGTLSKGFGVFGGIIPADINTVEDIHSKSPAFVGSTGLALPLAAAAVQSISYLQDNRHLITNLQKKTLGLKERFRGIGFDLADSPAPIFSITFYNKKRNERLRKMLIDNGIYPPFINYPGAPEGGHFRFIITSNNTPEQIDLLFDTVKKSV